MSDLSSGELGSDVIGVEDVGSTDIDTGSTDVGDDGVDDVDCGSGNGSGDGAFTRASSTTANGSVESIGSSLSLLSSSGGNSSGASVLSL